MFELSPSVVTTTASASSIPAVRSSWMSIPWPTWNSPVQSSPSRPSASSRSSITLTSQPAARRSQRDGAADAAASDHQHLHACQRSPVAPARLSRAPAPRRARAAGTRRSSTSHGAWRSTKSTVGEKKRDWRRQRGEEPSTIRSALSLARTVDDRPADRAGADGRRPRPRRRARAPSARASSSDASARASASGIGCVERELERHEHDVQRLDGRRGARRRA